MNKSLPSRFIRQTGRVLLILLLVACLQGGSCSNDNNTPHHTETHEPPLNGNTPTTVPPANVIPQLITLINNYRTGQGLPTLTQDPTGNTVANDEVTAWQNAGYPASFSYDVLGDLQSHGESSSQSLDSLAQGYSSAQALFNALQTQNSLSGPYTYIGVALINQGNGNDWAIVMY